MASGLRDRAEDLAEIEVRAPGGGADDDLFAELAWCLARFVEGSADEPTMERARKALARCDHDLVDW